MRLFHCWCPILVHRILRFKCECFSEQRNTQGIKRLSTKVQPTEHTFLQQFALMHLGIGTALISALWETLIEFCLLEQASS